ncbi:glutamate racemase [Glycomyces paridis]|uniref:Glutamate racemase n=1 Tax=Glycomyces paridis TaxID=2126555 RepID=A0A4S8PQX6_9ACTN|nr:glutamate racemase [Glycomyces paridis]THV32125.1 glutamate racemase [Glycomyces paridis]
MNDAPIGIFDSGVGGLTVARAISELLPAERLVYVGDTAHVPYGPRPIAEVRKLSLDVCDHLVEQEVKALVIACNSASAASLADIRDRYDIPVVEVIRPAVRRAVATTGTGRIGVLGTVSTISSGAYLDAFNAVPDVEVTAVACPAFVDFVERGVTTGRQLLGLAQGYLEPLQQSDVDTVVLGCTHYPLLSGLIGLVMGEDVTLVNSGSECARELYRVLTERDLLAARTGPAEHRFLATGDPAAFTRTARRFLGNLFPNAAAAVLAPSATLATRNSGGRELP